MTMVNFKPHLITKKLKLTAVTPIFIGGGENYRLSKSQYVYMHGKRKVYVPDEKKLLKLVKQYRQFEGFIENMKKGERLFRWFEMNLIKPDTWKQVINPNKIIEVDNSVDEKMNDLYLFIRNHEDYPYIPGSSIKGALRTFLLKYLINSEKYSLANDREKSKELENKLVKYQVFDLLNAISISDSEHLKLNETVIIQKCDLSTFCSKSTNKYDNRLPLYRECIKPGVSVDFTITINTKIIEGIINANPKLKGVIPESVSDIVRILDSSISDLFGSGCLYDNVFNHTGIPYQMTSEARVKPNLIIGGGAGFLSKTIVYSLNKNIIDVINKVKSELDRKFKKHKHLQLDTKISPRTLKLAKYNGTNYVMGYARIEEVKN